MPRGKANGASTRNGVDTAVWSACDVLRRSNCAGALQYVPELSWLLFLRVLDSRETIEADEREAFGESFTLSLEAPYRWRDWAAPGGPKRKELAEGTLGAVKGFVDRNLLPYLRGLRERPNATARQKVIAEAVRGTERTRVDTDRNLLDVIDRLDALDLAGDDYADLFPLRKRRRISESTRRHLWGIPKTGVAL